MSENLPEKRTKDTLSNLLNVVAGKVGGDIVLAVGKVVSAFRYDRAQDNLRSFFDALARGEDVWNDPAFHDKIKQTFQPSDFSDLLEAVAREGEAAKIGVYANLYTAFVDGKVTDARLRRQMILAARELTMTEIRLIRRVYDGWNVKISPTNDNIEETEQSIWESVLKIYDRQNQGYITLQTLERLGFMRKKEGYGDPEDYCILDFTFYFVRTAFDLDDEQGEQDDAE